MHVTVPVPAALPVVPAVKALAVKARAVKALAVKVRAVKVRAVKARAVTQVLDPEVAVRVREGAALSPPVLAAQVQRLRLATLLSRLKFKIEFCR